MIRPALRFALLLSVFALGCGGPKAEPWHDYSAPDLGLSASLPSLFDANDEAVPHTDQGATRYMILRARGKNSSQMFLLTCAVYPDAISAEQAAAAHDRVIAETESYAARVARKDRQTTDGITKLQLTWASNSGANSRVEDFWTDKRHVRAIVEGADANEINGPDVDRFFESIKISPMQ